MDLSSCGLLVYLGYCAEVGNYHDIGLANSKLSSILIMSKAAGYTEAGYPFPPISLSL